MVTGRRLRAWVRAAAQHHLGRRAAVALALIAVTLAGMGIGLLLGGHVQQDVSPFSAQFAITPALNGGTDVQIPPVGSLDLASHDGPAHLSVHLDALDQKRVEALFTNPNGINEVSQSAVVDVQRGVTRLVLRAAGAAILGALLLGALIFRSMRRVAICGGVALATIVASGGIALTTFRPGSVEEPQYHGLLANAPAVIGDARSIANRFDAYKAELQRLVDNVTRLYTTVSTLPVYQPTAGSVRVLHVSDLHLNPAAWPLIQTVVQQYQINLVIDTGDINDWGTQTESSFVDSIGSLKVPYVYIRGNHDSAVTAAAVAKQPNAIVLENRIVNVNGLTIAGIGDPRFTPDKTSGGVDNPAHHQIVDRVLSSGDQLAGTVRDYGKTVDIGLVHDPAAASGLDGVVPLVLAGHLHARSTATMPPIPRQQKTLLMVEGSTGGAGLRGLEGEAPTPLEMSVLYFDPQHSLQAYDSITLGGTGQTEVTIDRHVVTNGVPNASPSPSPSPSR
jgi:predicted phosphodiesterase